MEESQQVDDRQLARAVKAQEKHGEQQVAHPQAMKQHGALYQPVLEKQDKHQQQQGQRDHDEFKGPLLPQQHPRRFIGGGGPCGGRGFHAGHGGRRAARYAVCLGDAGHRLVDRTGQYHGGDGGAGDAVYPLVALPSPGSHPNAVGAFLALELVDEGLQVAIGYAYDQDRLLVVQDMHPADKPVLAEPHHGVDGFAGVGGDGRNGLGTESVPQLAARAADHIGRGLAVERGDGFRRRKHMPYIGQGQLPPAGKARPGELAQEAQQEQQVANRHIHNY